MLPSKRTGRQPPPLKPRVLQSRNSTADEGQRVGVHDDEQVGAHVDGDVDNDDDE